MSSLKDLASLIMVPSLYKDGELHTVKPLADENIIVHPDATDNNDGFDGSTPSTSSNFTFSRGSNLAATRVDVNGLIEKGRENLLTNSNDFGSTSWGGSTTETSGQSGYDGSNAAWLIENAANGKYIRQDNTSSGVLTASVYAKAGNVNWVRFAVSNSPVVSVYFDLVNGVSSVPSNVISQTIVSVGNGWHRLSVTFLANSMSGMQFYPADGANDLGETGDNIFLQDAQLELGLVATDYIETGTSAAQSGILEDMPRLDYSGGASCPSLLLEPQRTNLIVNSEYSVNSWGGVRRVSPTANAGISPEGLSNATKVDETAVSGTHMFDYNFTATSGVTYTFSYFAKAAERNECYLFGYTDGGVFSSQRAIFDLSDGTIVSNVGNGIADIQPYNDGWYRVSLTLTAQASSSAGYWGIGLSLDSATSYLGVASNGIYMYGFQHEVGSYPTSYIPTYGTSQTRSDDVALGQSISLGNSHTIFFNGELNTIDNNKVFMELITSSSTTSATIRNVIGTLRLYNQIDSNYPLGGIQSTNNKWVMRIDGNNYALFYNNAGTPTSQSGTFATARDMDRINLKGGFTEYNTKQVLAFPTALSDAECKSLVQ